uniref:Uncharacterized protein n=1 Tax=Rhizophagus irregularis (strain DAOM 181602 / DAOM 197198 / MUCL 43194) TaxID=747089 RepID=U9UJC7_RHIID
MPVQLSTILYISEYREKTPGEFFIGIAIRYTRLEDPQDTSKLTKRLGRHFKETEESLESLVHYIMPVNRKSFMQRARKTVRDMVRAREHRNRINGISTVGNISNSQFVERIASNNTEFEPHIRRDSATDQSEVDASTVAAGQEIQLVFYTWKNFYIEQ